MKSDARPLPLEAVPNCYSVRSHGVALELIAQAMHPVVIELRPHEYVLLYIDAQSKAGVQLEMAEASGEVAGGSGVIIVLLRAGVKPQTEAAKASLDFRHHTFGAERRCPDSVEVVEDRPVANARVVIPLGESERHLCPDTKAGLEHKAAAKSAKDAAHGIRYIGCPGTEKVLGWADAVMCRSHPEIDVDATLGVRKRRAKKNQN